ncbi:MAG: helix-turn-helix domain-containing protein [Planctomycetota bacterium]
MSDASLQSGMQPWIQFECLQLEVGAHVAELDAVDVGAFQVVRERQLAGVQKLGITPADVCTISSCTPDPNVRFTQFRTGAVDEVFFLPARTEFDVYVPATALTRYVSFSQEAFLDAVRTLDPAGWADARSLHVIPGARQADFDAAVDLLLELPDSEQARTIGLHALASLVTAAPGAPPSYRERLFSYQICRWARAYIEGQFDRGQAPSIVDVCREVKVSRRRLEYAFREYAGVAPLQYIRRTRLSRVRAALRKGDRRSTSVTEVALQFGFVHLSRFAQDYARMFGELPSQTLARR